MGSRYGRNKKRQHKKFVDILQRSIASLERDVAFQKRTQSDLRNELSCERARQEQFLKSYGAALLGEATRKRLVELTQKHLGQMNHEWQASLYMRIQELKPPFEMTVSTEEIPTTQNSCIALEVELPRQVHRFVLDLGAATLYK